jgi:hypothetical protein
MRRVVADRAGITPDDIASGHCVALSRPTAPAELLAGYSAAARSTAMTPRPTRTPHVNGRRTDDKVKAPR